MGRADPAVAAVYGDNVAILPSVMPARIPFLIISLLVVLGVAAAACGSSSDSQFQDPSTTGSSGAASSSGMLGSSGGGDGSTKPCTGLCLQQQTCAGGGTTSLSGTVMDPEVVAKLLARRSNQVPVTRLSLRERDVLALLATRGTLS